MEEVELVEHDADPADPVDHVERARGAVRERARAVLHWLSGHRVLAAATVGAVVVAVAVPAALSARSERARTAALTELPGVLAPLASAPQVAWTAPPTQGSYALTAPDHAWVRDGVLVMWEQTGDATSSLRALDARTGDEAWTAPLSSVPDLGDPEDRITEDPTTCVAPASGDGGGVVVCLVADSWALTGAEDDTEPELVEAATVRLRGFDAATGETVLDLPVERHVSFAPVGTDLVLVSPPEPGDGPARLVRLDPATRSERWSVDVARPSAGAGAVYPSVRLLEDEIGVRWLGTTALFTADGEAAGELDSDNVWELRGNRVTLEGGGATGGQLRDLDTGRVLVVDGHPTWLATDDLTVPDVLVLESVDRLTGRHLSTGQRAWQVDWPTESTQNLVVVDGMLARQADDGLTVIDLATGDQLWRRSVSAAGNSMVTDGRRLLVIESVVGTGLVVAAYDARDGRRVWEAPLRVAVQDLAVVDNRLFAVGVDGVVSFGAD
ncbi:hypothetical protein CXY01_24500 [Cellulomonas xylanilytica]|uniref:Pyrrolo-quinoline quinone repeat domain-containing protein n=2 Tax=Cellulomonas xylanilytica TaxID=233583 RepID=A0A510V9I5_9CELL|nr:hypothetical protein CXY01_24500 [Cellulomonas xylanilytica]